MIDEIPSVGAWQALKEHFQEDISSHPLKSLFALGGNGRFSDLSFNSNGLLLDISKQRLTPKTLDLLGDLAEEKGLNNAIESLFTGKNINWSENRPALHTALRETEEGISKVDGVYTSFFVHKNLENMHRIVEKVQSGRWLGYSGKPISTIVNIGVGGSDVGPNMVCRALDEFKIETKYPLDFLFVSSMDGSQLAEVLHDLDQETTLFIIASKTFTTVDTLANAETARAWLRKKIQSEEMIGKHHFIGCSSYLDRMSGWGIPGQNHVELWDWVGGRYSLWSGIGLPIAMKIGMKRFKELLAGAEAMDLHFRKADFMCNLPVLLALVGIWNINMLGLKAHTILPYDGRLKLLPNYLSQLEMESNGKTVTSSGKRVSYNTSPVIWGDVGANAQHAYFQLLHQGTPAFFADFIVPVKRRPSKEYSKATQNQLKHQQNLNLASCIAQSRVLMMGDSVLDWEEPRERSADRLYAGNHASTTIMIDELTPISLGSLLALYEHKVYVQAVIWDINPFDQWGVELGKLIAKETLDSIQGHNHQSEPFDIGTQGLISHINHIGNQSS